MTRLTITDLPEMPKKDGYEESCDYRERMEKTEAALRARLALALETLEECAECLSSEGYTNMPKIARKVIAACKVPE